VDGSGRIAPISDRQLPLRQSEQHAAAVRTDGAPSNAALMRSVFTGIVDSAVFTFRVSSSSTASPAVKS
jgi:hypothetical protein